VIKRYNPTEDVKAYVADLSAQLSANQPLTTLMAGQTTPTTLTFVPPPLTTAERDALANPGRVLILNTSTGKLNFWNGSAWEAVTSA
jgi:hypothetical protein